MKGIFLEVGYNKDIPLVIKKAKKIMASCTAAIRHRECFTSPAYIESRPVLTGDAGAQRITSMNALAPLLFIHMTTT